MTSPNSHLRRIGEKRLRALEKIERSQRKTFDKGVKCPSCSHKFGTNFYCVACQIKANNRSGVMGDY